MSARRIQLPPERIGPTRAELTEPARHHLRDVLRLGPGDAVELFDGLGATWEARIEPGFAGLALGVRRDAEGAARPIHLLFSLARGERCDLIVQKATELGVVQLVPWAAARSVVRLDEGRGADRAERWRRIAREAARQCGRADVPAISPPGDLAAALAAVPSGTRIVVLHGGAGAPLAGLDLGAAGGVAALVGPEGGLTDAELAAAAAAGAARASLGPRTLRTETAAIVAVAVLQALVGDLR